MWKLFDQYFDSILHSSHESRLKKIIESTIAGAYHFVESSDADMALQMMQVQADFVDLRENEYIYILSKVYSQLRHVLYIRFQELLDARRDVERSYGHFGQMASNRR